MDKTFEVEVVRLAQESVLYAAATIRQRPDGVSLLISNGFISTYALLTASEAVTIGEQLIAAGKAEGQA
ncbi:TPA: hypothetical protein R4K21_003175 [Stenotrophomonas maltophilia]|nr:hypothetical protein [Stenotrophomonas maltophilia]